MEPHKQKKTWRDSAPIYIFLSAVSVLVVVQLSSEVPEGLMNYPVYSYVNDCKGVENFPGSHFVKSFSAIQSNPIKK
jgi:hypothetical protein